MNIIKTGTIKGIKWQIVQTNSGQLGSATDYQMVVPGVFKSDFFRSLEKWSLDREIKQAKSFINALDALQISNVIRANRGELIGE